MDGIIRCGVVGLGRSGWDIHVAGLRGHDDFRIVAVADPNPERREQAAGELGCSAYESAAGLLEDRKVELVILATPSFQHATDTLAALRASKHVVVEKPMATTSAEAESMLAESRRANRHLFVHHQHRFGSLFRQFQSILASGKLGRLFHVQFRYVDFSRRQDWQTLTRMGGGILNNSASHYLDLILALIDSPITQVMGDLKQVVSPGDAEDHFKALLRAENGCTIDIEVSTAQALPAAGTFWQICGTCGTLFADEQTITMKWFDPAQLAPLHANDGPAAGRQYLTDHDFPWNQSNIAVDESKNLLFYDNVRDVLRSDAPMRVTAGSVCNVIRTIERIRQSSGGIWRVAEESRTTGSAVVNV